MGGSSINTAAGGARVAELSKTLLQCSRAADLSQRTYANELSTARSSVVCAGLVHGIGSLTKAEQRIAEDIMGKPKPRDVLAAMREAIERRQKRDDERNQKAWQFLDDPMSPNPWTRPARNEPKMSFEPDPNWQVTVQSNPQEPVFQFLDDPHLPELKYNPVPSSRLHGGQHSWRFDVRELDDAVLHLSDGETTYSRTINKNFLRDRQTRWYIARWHPMNLWLTHETEYVFEFWYTEVVDGRHIHHFTEV